MKNLSLIALCVLLNACSELDKRFGLHKVVPKEDGRALYSVTPYGNKIIVAMGQSNILGRGQTELFPAHARVLLTRDIRTGPAYYASTLLANQFMQWDIVLIQCGEGSTTIDRWIKGGDRYERCVSETRSAMIKGGQVIGIMFYQGESDTRDRLNENWPEQFSAAARDFRADIGIPALPIVWAELGMLGGAPFVSKEIQYNWDIFKANQRRAVVLDSLMIQTDDQPVVDDVHHGYEANMIIGERFYYALLNLLAVD